MAKNLQHKFYFNRIIHAIATFFGFQLLLFSIVVAQRNDNSLRQGFSYLNQGISDMNERRWDEALQSLTKAEHIFIRFQDQTSLFYVFFRKGEVYRNQEANEIADSLYSRALNCFQNLDSLQQASLQTMIPALYLAKSLVNSERNLTQAIQYGEKALLRFKKFADWDNYYRCAGLLKNLYDRVEPDKSLQMQRILASKNSQADSIHLSGKTEELQRAGNRLDTKKVALQALKSAPTPADSAVILNQLAIAFFRESWYEQALINGKKAYSLWQKTGNRRELIYENNFLGYIYFMIGKHDTSKQYFLRAIQMAKGTSYDDVAWYSYYGLGNCFAANDNLQDAYQALQTSIRLVESVRNTLGSSRHKEFFFGKKLDVYNKMITLLIRMNRVAEAVEFAERARARAFLDMLGARHVLKTKHQSLENRWKMIALARQPETATVQNAITSIVPSDKMIDFQNQFPEISSFISIHPVKLSSIQKQLDENTALLYYHLQNSLYVWVITNKACKFAQLDKSLLEANVYDYLNMLDRRHITSKYHDTIFYNVLIKPVAKSIKNFIRIGILPSGLLHYLSFPEFWDGKNYFLQEHELFYLPSLSVYKIILKKRKKCKGPVLAVANSRVGDRDSVLQYTQKEVDAIHSIFTNTNVLLGGEATKKNIIAQLYEKPNILHFACHAELYPERPLASYLQLAGDENSDGKLTVKEIFQLDLNASLVVLSACRTALGKVRRGDELVSLSRAFLYAGAPSILATQWQVDDQSTEKIMVEFYSNLKSGMTKVAALREAQLNFLDLGGGKANPFFWAPFKLLGDWQ